MARLILILALILVPVLAEAGGIYGPATSLSLSSNPTDCNSASERAVGIDATGAAECATSCFTVQGASVCLGGSAVPLNVQLQINSLGVGEAPDPTLGTIKLYGTTSGAAVVKTPAIAGTPTLTLPTATGTLVGSGDTGTVSDGMLATPYIKADGTRGLSGDWNAGAFEITAKDFKVSGASGAGYLELPEQASAPGTPTNAARFFIDASNRFSWKGENGFVRTFDGTANSADRVYVLPDLAGTVALTSGQAHSVTSLTTPSLIASSSVVGIGGTSSSFPGLKNSGANLELRKADDSGYTLARASALEFYSGANRTATAGFGGFDFGKDVYIEWWTQTIYGDGSADLKIARSGAKTLTIDDASGGAAQLRVSGLKVTGAAGSKNVVCADTATGQLYVSSTGTDCSN